MNQPESRPRTPPPLRLITIDLDDTVWPCAPVIRAAEEAQYAWLAASAPRLAERFDQEALRAHRLALMAQRPELAHDVTAVRRESLRRLLAEHDYDPEHADAAMALFRDWRNRVEPYADSAPALRLLRERQPVVALTNGNAELHQTPLHGLFHHALTAADAGAAKPHPAMFEQAMAWAGANAAETLHVGDDPVRDVEAAQRIGIAAVWVNRTGLGWPEELPPPVLEVTDLHALVAWLDRAADRPAAPEDPHAV